MQASNIERVLVVGGWRFVCPPGQLNFTYPLLQTNVTLTYSEVHHRWEAGVYWPTRLWSFGDSPENAIAKIHTQIVRLAAECKKAVESFSTLQVDPWEYPLDAKIAP